MRVDVHGEATVECPRRSETTLGWTAAARANVASWNEATPEGRRRSFTNDDLAKRNKLNLDIFWLKDKSLEESEDLPEPEVLAQEIIEDLQAAPEQFSAVAAKLVDD